MLDDSIEMLDDSLFHLGYVQFTALLANSLRTRIIFISSVQLSIFYVRLLFNFEICLLFEQDKAGSIFPLGMLAQSAHSGDA